MATRGTPSERLSRSLERQSNGCLEWMLSTNDTGYGHIKVDGKILRVHRLAWELKMGPIPPGMDVLHRCDNPPCCDTEPSEEYPEGHLFLGTHDDNMADRAAKGRCHTGPNRSVPKTHCPEKHEYSEANTFINSMGRVECRMCIKSRAPARNAYKRNLRRVISVVGGRP